MQPLQSDAWSAAMTGMMEKPLPRKKETKTLAAKKFLFPLYKYKKIPVT